MEAGTVTQIISTAVAVLAIVWNQQRTIGGLRGEMHSDISELCAVSIENGQRLARIVGLGMPAEAASESAGGGTSHVSTEPRS
ncbi:hypothetical protein [Candidatus Poriferisodalis sp.]|uniref:hypothetical protein n=1 Tax=Candidatus Poriferisodalis sp. TaxID=3101277 RepID=UPI003AF64136